MITILQGDVIEQLRTLPDESVHCCVTSPPYWALRDYGTAQWEGGDDGCDHLQKAGQRQDTNRTKVDGFNGPVKAGLSELPFAHSCGKCGAKRIDSQLGLEKTPEEYVAKMVEVFREVRRVLRKDGTLWLNLGDSYASGEVGRHDKVDGGDFTSQWNGQKRQQTKLKSGLKPKDLCGIPWRVAFALQADGWVLRSDIVWSKPNPMPESVTDRPTKSHEYLFLFSKAKWTGNGEPPIWISDVDKAWLAALIDGEGTICFQSSKEGDDSPTRSPRLSIVNTNIELLNKVARICNVGGGPGSPSPRFRGDGSESRPVYCWQVTNAKAATVIAAIRPYLIAKSTQADLVLTVHVLNQKRKARSNVTTPADAELKRRCSEACSALNNGRETDLSWFKPVEWGRWDSQPYMYDAEAIKEQHCEATIERSKYRWQRTQNGGGSKESMTGYDYNSQDFGDMHIGASGRNKRSVWTVATAPYPEAHFATYPPDLIKPCILAGTSAKGCCVKCGSPWERVTETKSFEGKTTNANPELERGPTERKRADGTSCSQFAKNRFGDCESKTIGWQSTCNCMLKARGMAAFDPTPEPCTVLDPFAGSGTTGAVALEFGRKAVLIELNPKYVELIKSRCNVTPGLQLAV